MIFSGTLTDKNVKICIGDFIDCVATIDSNTFVKLYVGQQCIGYIPKREIDYDVAKHLRGRWPARVRSIDSENSLTLEFVGNIV